MVSTDWTRITNGWRINTRGSSIFSGGYRFTDWEGGASYTSSEGGGGSGGITPETVNDPLPIGDGEVNASIYVSEECEPQLVHYLAAWGALIYMLVKLFFMVRSGKIPTSGDIDAMIVLSMNLAAAQYAYESCIEANSW